MPLAAGALSRVVVNQELFGAVYDASIKALAMCDVEAHCVGSSSVPGHGQFEITGLIGIHGKVTGFMSVSMGNSFAIRAVGGLLQEEYQQLTSQVVDGVGEITNIIVGGVKSNLASSSWGFNHITVPSVIIGDGYNLTYGRGLTFLSVTFERQDAEAFRLGDRLLQVSVSLLPV